jgi:hypothetical protein
MDSHHDFISCDDFEILCHAFRTMEAKGLISEARRLEHARALVRELTGQEHVGGCVLNRIASRYIQPPIAADSAWRAWSA